MGEALLRIIAHPRLHLGLCDMGRASRRAYGGIGFSVTEPKTVLECEAIPSPEFDMVGFDDLDDPGREDLRAILDRLRTFESRHGCRIIRRSSAPEHVGFGSKTTMAMSLIAGVNACLHLNLTREHIQRLSGRGAASGIGLHAFFTGGIVCDGGHPTSHIANLGPSNASSPAQPPPLLARHQFPEDWRVALMLPRGKRYSRAEERQFFAANTPLPEHEALQTFSALYHGVLPAFAEANLAELAESLREIHSIGFKKREIHGQTPAVRALLTNIGTLPGVAAGMSSMGPLIFAIFSQSDNRAKSAIATCATEFSAQLLCISDGCNSGYEFSGEIQ